MIRKIFLALSNYIYILNFCVKFKETCNWIYENSKYHSYDPKLDNKRETLILQ